MLTYVPKRYQVSDETISALDKTITTLFELLDSDNDGLITWQEFYQYYSISCDESDTAILPHVDYSRKQQVFKYIQKNSDQESGKTGKITVDTLIENYNEVADLPGVKILNILQLQDNFYITTDTGLYQYDSMFLFPKTIFEPSLQLIQVNTRQTQKIDEKKFIQNLKTAENDLGKMGVQIPTFQRKHLDDGSQNMKQLQKLTVSPTVQNCKTIIDSCYLSPYGIFAITTQYPGLFFVNTKAQVSDFFELESTVTHLRWDEQTNALYIGHISGKVSAYKLSFMDEVQIRENQEKEMERKRAQERSKSFLDKLYNIFDKKGLPHKQESVYKLSKHELASLYPEMQQLYVQTSMNAEEIKAKKQKIQQQIDQIMGIRAEDFELSNLVSKIIFHMDHSVVELNNINMREMIKSDPQAYLQACTNMVRLDNLYKIQKHGKVKLSVQVELIAQNYVVSGPIKCMDIGRGRWEAYIQTRNLLRVVVSSTDGSILVLDEVFNEIASFPNMYDDGIINLHVCEDNIITVGYSDVYLIDGPAVASAHKGFVIVKENDREAMAEIAEEELIEGNLVKAYTQVRLLQPPRPGTPIMHSFLMGDVLGVIDHQNILTLSYAFTGAHIARTSCNLPDLQLSRFGKCSYNFTRDIGYLPVGKMVFYVKAEPNEDIEEDNNIMDVLSLQQKDDEKVAQGVYQENVPIGTANRKLLCSCFNQIQNELALVTDDLEVTIYSLNTGHPVRVINLETYQDDYAITYKQNDYTSIESNDLNQYLAENKLKSTRQSKGAQDDLLRCENNPLNPECRSKSLPTGKLPNILSHKKQKAFNSILDMVGAKIFGITTNSKGTILYIFGETGTLTLYWDTGKLFDMNNVNIVGLKVQGLPESGVIKNPFQVQKVSMLEKEKIENDTQLKEGYLSTFSLNIRFDDVIKQENGNLKNTNIKQRSIMLCSDKTHGRCFVSDSLVPDRVFQIATEISKDFFDKPENTRVLNVLRLQKQKNMDIANYDSQRDSALAGLPLVCDFKASIRKYFSESQNYKGVIDNMYGLQKIAKFICSDFINWEKRDAYPKQQTFYQNFLHAIINELDAEPFAVTVMDVSPQLGLIACGTTEGTVQLFDSYVNMLPSGFISVPYLVTRPAITSLKFCGEYPILFVGTQDGGIYLYTVRPYMPSGQLVCAFQHGNYHPINRPMDIDLVQKAIKLRGFIKSSTQIARWTSNQYTIAKNKQEDVIKHVLFTHQMDLRGSKYVKNTYISQFFEDYIERTRAQAEAENTTPLHNQANALDESGQLKQLSSMTTIDQKHFAQGSRQIYNYTSMQSGQQHDQKPKTKETNSKAHLHDYSKDIALINESLWAMSTGTPQENRTQSAISGKSGKSGSKDGKKSQKTKRVVYKIQAAVSLVGSILALMDLGMVSESRKPVYLMVPGTSSEGNTGIVHDVNSLFSGANAAAKKPAKLKQRHEISLVKTEQFLRLQQKNQYRSKREDTDARVLRLPDGPEDASGETGLVYKRMYVAETGDPVNVPVRLADHYTLRTRVAPTAMLYDQHSSQLIVGDEHGFITHYNIESLIKTAQLKSIQPNVLKIQTDTGVQTVSRGYLPQSLPKDPNAQHKNLLVQGLFSAEALIETTCSYRAHRSKVQQLECLVGSGAFMTVGEDRRVLCFDIADGALRGSVQRVQLQQASPSVSKYFCQGVGRNGMISQLEHKRRNSMTLGLPGKNGPSDEFQVPPSRLEFPPACRFEWLFHTVVEKLSQEQLVDADLFQGVSENDRVKGRGQAVPIYDQNPHTAFLQSTGLTTQALQKHSNTWTVKAIIKRALGKCNPEEPPQEPPQQQTPVKTTEKNKKKTLSTSEITEDNTTDGLASSVVHIEPVEEPVKKETPRAKSVDRAQLTKEILEAFAPQTAKTDAPTKHSFRRGGMKGVKVNPVEEIDDYL